MKHRFSSFSLLLVLVVSQLAQTQETDNVNTVHNSEKASANAKPDRVTYTSSHPGNWDIYLFKQF